MLWYQILRLYKLENIRGFKRLLEYTPRAPPLLIRGLYQKYTYLANIEREEKHASKIEYSWAVSLAFLPPPLFIRVKCQFILEDLSPAICLGDSLGLAVNGWDVSFMARVSFVSCCT